jgi:hypothetical protein
MAEAKNENLESKPQCFAAWRDQQYFKKLFGTHRSLFT